MYLRGSKWNMTKRSRRRSSFWRIGFLVVIILGLLYFNQVVVPAMPAPFVPTTTPTRSAESFLNEADAFFKDGKLTQAIDAYKQAILADPKNPAYYVDMARLQVFAGLYKEAQTSAEDALLLNPNNSMAHAVKAWALDFLGQYPEATASIQEALKLDPNNAAAYAYYTEILIDQGNYDDIETAISMSQKARDLAPNMLETHRARGYVLYATGNYADAIQEYKAALAINDKIWDLHYSLGVVYRINGDFDLASQEMLAAIAFNPENPDIPTDLSRTYATQGQFGKAVQYAEQAVKVAPSDPRLHGNLGFMYYKNSELDNALTHLALAVRGGTTADGVVVEGLPLQPGRVADEYYSFYGLALAKKGRCNEAVPVFQLILQNIAADQTAFYNANEGITYCQEQLGTPQANPTNTPGP
jgi:tetratricopeptide (TPR) repeat protein